MEHKIILCSAKCLSNSGLVSGAVLKNCGVDHSRLETGCRKPRYGADPSSLYTAPGGLDGVSGDRVYGLSSFTKCGTIDPASSWTLGSLAIKRGGWCR